MQAYGRDRGRGSAPTSAARRHNVHCVRASQAVELRPPDPPLADDLIALEPFTQAHVPYLMGLTRDDDIIRFTRVPLGADEAFVVSWIGRYETGWADGTRAGFTIVDQDGGPLGFAAFVQLDREAGEGEIGYAIDPQARGRGIATRSLDLLTRWGFDELGLERIELVIDVQNAGSARVAERGGYTFEGVLRSKYFKDGLRSDLAIWSRLRGDQP
jgi:RimJ/RimL family protein N-acetyltransferase